MCFNKKRKTTTVSTAPPQAVQNLYTTATNATAAAADNPYVSFGTQASDYVAPLTDQQKAGMAGVDAAVGGYTPYMNAGVNATGAGLGYMNTGMGTVGQGVDAVNAGIKTAKSGLTNIKTGEGYVKKGMGSIDQGTEATKTGMGPANLGSLNIQQYLSPYLSEVRDSTAALMNQANNQAQSQALGTAISSGAFGGDRAGIAAANLNQQNQLAMANAMSNISNQGYQFATDTAQGQQAADLAARQANLQRILQGGAQFGVLGTQQGQLGAAAGTLGAQKGQIGASIGNMGAQLGTLGTQQGDLGTSVANAGKQLADFGTTKQTLDLQAANAQLNAGAVQQENQQAGIDAMIKRYQQEQGYDFQTAQFMANQYATLGPLYGSTTTTVRPTNIFGNPVQTGGRVNGYAKGGGISGPMTMSQMPLYEENYIPERIFSTSPMLTGEEAKEDEKKKGNFISTALNIASFLSGRAEGGAVNDRHGYATDGGVLDPKNRIGLAEALIAEILGDDATKLPVSDGRDGKLPSSRLVLGTNPQYPKSKILSPITTEQLRNNINDPDYYNVRGFENARNLANARSQEKTNPANMGIGAGYNMGYRSYAHPYPPSPTTGVVPAPDTAARYTLPTTTGVAAPTPAALPTFWPPNSPKITLNPDGSSFLTYRDGVVSERTKDQTDARFSFYGTTAEEVRASQTPTPTAGVVARQPNAAFQLSSEEKAADRAMMARALGAREPRANERYMLPTGLSRPPVNALDELNFNDPYNVAATIDENTRPSFPRLDLGNPPPERSEMLSLPQPPSNYRPTPAETDAKVRVSGLAPAGGTVPAVKQYIIGGQLWERQANDTITDMQGSMVSDPNVAKALKRQMDIYDNLSMGGKGPLGDQMVEQFRQSQSGLAPTTSPQPQPRPADLGTSPAAVDNLAADALAAIGRTSDGLKIINVGSTPMDTEGLAGPENTKLATSVDPIDFFNTKIIRQESGDNQFDSKGNPLTSSAGAVGVAQVMEGTGPEAAKLAGLEWDRNRWLNDKEYNKALGQAYFLEQYRQFGSLDKAAAAYNAGPGAVASAIDRARAGGGSYLDYLPAETQNYVYSTTGMGSAVDAGGSRGEGLGGADMARQDNDPLRINKPYEDRNLIGKFFHDPATGKLDRNAIMSLLSGVGGMVSSDSLSPLTALLQGAAVGSETYNKLQNEEPKRVADILLNSKNARFQYLTEVELGEERPFDEWAATKFSSGPASMFGLPKGSVSLDQPTGKIDIMGRGLSEEITLPDGVIVQGGQNYAFLTKLANDLQPYVAAGVPAAINTAATVESRLNDIRESQGVVQDINGNDVKDPTYTSVIDTQTRLAFGREKTQEFEAKAIQGQQRADRELSMINHQVEVFTRFPAGALATDKAAGLAILQSLGVPVPTDTSDYAAAAQEALKGAARKLLDSIGTDAPAAEMAQLQQAIESPNMQPEAIKTILSMQKAQAEREKNYYKLRPEWNAKNPSMAMDQSAYEDWFTTEHGFEEYYKNAKAGMPLFAGELGSKQKPYALSPDQDENGNYSRADTDYNNLPPGVFYTDPNGIIKQKPRR